jgi:hypothetical protein
MEPIRMHLNLFPTSRYKPLSQLQQDITHLRSSQRIIGLQLTISAKERRREVSLTCKNVHVIPQKAYRSLRNCLFNLLAS